MGIPRNILMHTKRKKEKTPIDGTKPNDLYNYTINPYPTKTFVVAS